MLFYFQVVLTFRFLLPYYDLKVQKAFAYLQIFLVVFFNFSLEFMHIFRQLHAISCLQNTARFYKNHLPEKLFLFSSMA